MSEAQFRYIVSKRLGETGKQVAIISMEVLRRGEGHRKQPPHPHGCGRTERRATECPLGYRSVRRTRCGGGIKGRRNHTSQRGKPSFPRRQPVVKANQGVAGQRKVKYHTEGWVCLRSNRDPPNMGFPLKRTLADMNLLLFTFSSTSKNCCFSSFSKLTSRKGDLDYSC